MPASSTQDRSAFARAAGWLARIAAPGLAALLSTGCATASSEFGTRARFSPAFQGYVMAADQGSDDPGAQEKVLVLRDPLTGNKLRCREEVVAWRELHEDLAEDRVRDDKAALAVLDKAYFYLGLSYYVVGRRDRARLALSMFVDRALVRDVEAYRTSEGVLRALGVPRAACASTEPVELHF